MRSARLFAAVPFTDGQKRALAAAARALGSACASGRFVPAELMHVTLHFFGQTPLDRLPAIEAAMRQAAREAGPFAMAAGRAGSFRRGDSSVLWIGIGRGARELSALQAGLEQALAAQGFAPESRAFRAHVTMGRDVRLAGDVTGIALPEVQLDVDRIALMESTQRSGRLEYIPLLQVELRGKSPS